LPDTIMLDRPRPCEILFDIEKGDQFIPAPEIIEWARATFIDEGAHLHNGEHGHLEQARIGALWTNVGNSKNGRTIVGQCELGDPMAMGKWPKAKARIQAEQWFGSIPDFILTFDAAYADQCSDIEWCALVEHELLHAAQERDAFGAPKFSGSTGMPIWAIRGHDVQEFTSIVRRYGADAAHVREFVDAANRAPEIGHAHVAHACGVCLSRAA
jgi:hypothetical protein